MTEQYDWTLFAWAIDFIRCIEDMPVWRKLLIRFVMGRYAAREYVGMRDHLDERRDNQSQWGRWCRKMRIP